MRSLSNKEIAEFFDNKVNIILYPDIKNINSINQLLKPYNKCVILYKTSSNYGHWCCIFLNKNELHFFDSYGLVIDKELNFINKEEREELQQSLPYLSNLILKSNYEINYNDCQFQAQKDNVTSCGSWVILRLCFTDLNDDEFINFVKTLKIDDNKVSSLIENILDKNYNK